MPGQTIQRPIDQFVNAPVSDPRGELVLNLTPSNFRAYDNSVEQIMGTFGIGNSPLSAAMQAVPPSATPPRTLGLSAHAGHAADAHDRGSACWRHRPRSAGRVGGEACECVQNRWVRCAPMKRRTQGCQTPRRQAASSWPNKHHTASSARVCSKPTKATVARNGITKRVKPMKRWA